MNSTRIYPVKWGVNMPKKTSLTDAFKVNNTELQPNPESPDAAPQSKEKARKPKSPKKRHIGGYFDEAVYRQMKIVGAEQGLSTQAILAEALNAFFRMHDKPPIA